MKLIKFTFLLLFISGLANAQVGGDPKKAKMLFEFDKNYKDALTEYLKLYKGNESDPEINYRIGLCYLNSNIDKRKAFKYLEVMARQPKAPKDVYFELGRGYHLVNRFDDAIKRYSEFIDLAKLRPDEAVEVNRLIEQCRIGKKLVDNPVDVTMECLTKDINSPFPDMNPFISADESYMIFTSRRNTVTGGFRELDGQYSSDVFSATQIAGKWSKPKNLSSIVNTQYYEVATSMTPDGNNVVVYFSNETAQGDLYWLTKKNDKSKTYLKAVTMGGGVNGKAVEQAGAISPDGNTLIFSSERPGGKGGLDLWKSTKEGDSWGAPVNLGAPINTDADEDYPNFSPDGTKLYFSSNSAKSMGGYDVFWANVNKATENFDEPQNFGYPINTADDNQTISFNAIGNVAYVSQSKEGGIGDLDLWKITYNNFKIEVKKTKYSGIVKPSEGTATITVTDKFTGKEAAKTTTETGTGKYAFDLAPGRYIVKIEGDGITAYQIELPVLMGGAFKEKETKDFDTTAVPATTPGKTPVKPK